MIFERRWPGPRTPVPGAWWILLALLLAPAIARAAMPKPRAIAAPVPVMLVAQPRVIDDFESAGRWKAMPADGVDMKLSNDAGVHGKALRVDFKFVKGGGYAVFHRDLSLDLPANYRFTFRLRGACPPENLEFKLIDSTGANVWWCNRRDFQYPRAWAQQTIKQRQISFAWGPAGGGELHHVAAIEFAVTAGSGGAGTVWLDDLELTALPPAGGAPPPVQVQATSERAGHAPGMAVDGDPNTSWASSPRDKRPYLELDLGADREFGGVTLDWNPAHRAAFYVIETSYDKITWTVLRTVRNGKGARDALRLPESEGRWLRLRVLDGTPMPGVELRELTIMPLEWGATPEAYFEALAKAAPRGDYPRAIGGEETFWTVVGDASGDPQEALMSEDGAIEMGKRHASLEPFLYSDGRLTTWADVKIEQRLDGNGDWPLPRVDWTGGPLELSVTAFAMPGAEAQTALGVIARYRVHNPQARAVAASLFLAVRPFQVNPPAQFLNTPGGVAPVHFVQCSMHGVTVDSTYGITCVEPPSAFGAAAFDPGQVVDALRRGQLPLAASARDDQGTASAVMRWNLRLAPGGDTTISVIMPFHVTPGALAGAGGEPEMEREAERIHSDWDRMRGSILLHAAAPASGGLEIKLPFDAATGSIWPQLGYILTNRDGAAIQPGSRAYERSWIRDGSLTSSALLRLGQADVVKAFIEWFAPYQYADGKVPCCVDHRGSDPVPENDSHGEFIYLVAEYYRYTGDRNLVLRMWPHLHAAVVYMDSLRAQRRTAEWQAPDKREYYGLLPPSISHEGYSAKPMHSYWDDLFALRGYKDIVYLAGALGIEDDRERFARSRDEFAHDLGASVRAAMAVHKIDYIPGCADLGDFDATSTTIALNPVQAGDVLPQAALERTFERYWQYFLDRRDGKKDWDAYTPYELRTVGAFVRLGWRERAGELLAFFLTGQRPSGWKQWPEVVWKDARAPHFIGDLPHTWVGSDYVRSVLDMLAYTRESDSSLVIGAGVQQAWIEGDGLTVKNLPTPYGKLSYTMKRTANGVNVAVDPGLVLPPGGIVVSPPAEKSLRTASIDGGRPTPATAGMATVHAVPARIEFHE